MNLIALLVMATAVAVLTVLDVVKRRRLRATLTEQAATIAAYENCLHGCCEACVWDGENKKLELYAITHLAFEAARFGGEPDYPCKVRGTGANDAKWYPQCPDWQFDEAKYVDIVRDKP